MLNHPDYEGQRWHGTLLVIAITLFSIIFNTFLAKRLPFVEVLILILHVCGLFAIIIPLWVLGPRRSAKEVFTEFNNGGDWNSAGTATLVGFSTTITALIGYDCAVHMCTSRLSLKLTNVANIVQRRRSKMRLKPCQRR